MQDRKAFEKRINCTPGNLFPGCGNEPVEILCLLSYLALMEFHNYIFICYRQIVHSCRYWIRYVRLSGMSYS
jgi:hypothetical protein